VYKEGTVMKSFISSHRITFTLQCAAGLVVLAIPALADAQTATMRRAPERVALRTRGCAEITAMPTMLATTPEGRSVVKLQRELGAAAQNAAKRGEGTSDIRSIVTAQKGVDSLMQVIVQQMGNGTATIIVRDDSAGRPEFDRAMRSRIEATIREMQPRVAALAEAVGGAGGRVVQGHFTESGWIGLRISGSFFREATPSGLVTRYCDDYPVIEAVDPGSPAEKSGLLAGDTLLAFNNRDVLAHSIVHSETFVPGQQLRVRYRRVGRTREVPLVVAEPRSEMRFTYRSPTMGPLPCPGGNCERMALRDSLVTFRVSPEFSGTLQPSRVRAGAVSGAPPVPAVGMFMRDMNVTLVGGAQVALVGEELAQTLGLEQGLLVLRVLGGTPMADAGLRAGDVVRQINGAAARDLVALQRAFGVQGREAKLSVVSKGQSPRLVTVKW
jgi:serine protease Do